MANHITITKKTNGNVLIENTVTIDRVLQPNLDVLKNKNGLGVTVLNFDSREVLTFLVADVLKVVRDDGTEILITDLTTLFDELTEYFFFSVTGSGSGTGWAGEVNTFADLPAAADNTGAVYLVKTKTGSQLTFNLKRSGFYQSDGVNWTKISTVQFMFSDDELTFSDDVDNTKQLGFEISSISTGTRRTATFPDKNGTVAYLDDIDNTVIVNPVTPYSANNKEVILWDATSGNKTVDLPVAASSINSQITIKKIDGSGNTITVEPNGVEQVEYKNNLLITIQGESVTLICDGSNWFII